MAVRSNIQLPNAQKMSHLWKRIPADHVLRDVAEHHSTASRHGLPWSLYGLPWADFHRTHQSSTSLLTDRFALNFIQIRLQMWKVRAEQHDGLRQVWRSLFLLARHSDWRGESLHRAVPQPDEKCVTYGQAFLYSSNQSTVAAVPICTKLTTGWQYFVDIDGAEFRPNPSRSMGSASRNWLIALRETCPWADWRLFDNILYRTPLLNCMIPQKWFSRWRGETDGLWFPHKASFI